MGTQLSARHNQETKNVLQRPVNELLKMEIFNIQVTGTHRFYAAVCLLVINHR